MSNSKSRKSVRDVNSTQWKESLRQDCLKRVQEQRSQLLSKYRGTKTIPRSELQQIISSNLKNKGTSESNHQVAKSLEFSNNHQNFSHGPSSALNNDVSQINDKNNQAKQSGQSSDVELHELSVEEYEALMADLEASLFDEMQLEEHRKIEDADLDEISELFLNQVTLHSQPKSLGVVCPVCRKAILTEPSLNHIHCPIDDYCIEVQQNSSCLPLSELVKMQIEMGLQGHIDCVHEPEFVVMRTDEPSLFIQCHACGFCEAVL